MWWAACAAMALGGCAGGGPNVAATATYRLLAVAEPCPQGVVTITVKDFAFEPAAVTVASGTTVVWKFEGDHPHTSTSDGGSAMPWDSTFKYRGDTYQLTFDRAGTFGYHCRIHPRMTGVVTVVD
jgi:plastocyanin